MTSLSAGNNIYSMLSGSEDLTKRVTKIFTVAADEAQLPYIAYRRSKLVHETAKPAGADTVQIDIRCYTATYAEGVELAEAVREALDYRKGQAEGIMMRSCTLVDSSEEWTDDAYVQALSFNVRI